MDLVQRIMSKAAREHGIKNENEILLNLDYANNLSVLEENVGKMNSFGGIFGVYCTKIDLKIKMKKNKSLRLGIKVGKVVIFGNEKIDEVDS